MLAYRLFRALGRLALRWYYRDVEVRGLEVLPNDGPALLAGNHPNALVDALVIGCTLERAVTLTAKATLLENPLTRVLLQLAGVVPLRRASDAVRLGGDGILDPTRNAAAFSAVLNVLEHNGLVLFFPEGKSHSEPSIAPLKTGLARIAIMAHDECGLQSLPIIPVGLTFERKSEPRSRVLMQLGAPIVVDDTATNGPDAVERLTERVDTGLRRVTLNFRSDTEARRIVAISSLVTDVFSDFRPLGVPDPPLTEQVDVAQRLTDIATAINDTPELTERIDRFLERLIAFEQFAERHDVRPSDVQMTTDVGSGARFAIREGGLALIAIPLALFGRVNHWLPLRIARTLARRVSRTADEPAMNTIVIGFALVLAFYTVQLSFVAWWLGAWPTLIYAVLLPISASWDFRYADRMRRAVGRIRTYLRFRRDPAIRARLVDDAHWLRAEAIMLDSELREGAGMA